MNDYRYNPFENVSTAVTITGETHVIPSVSPYTIRLDEVPLKETPSSISLTIAGSAGAEVSAAPAAGEFWPDYSTGADGDDGWNTGTILFNSADAGKTVVVSYKGTGTLADTRNFMNTLIKLTTSGTFTASYTGWHRITLVGGSGGGGGSGKNGDTSNAAGGGGGGGGASDTVIFYAYLTAGNTYTYIIGAGGSAGSAGSSVGYGGNPGNGGGVTSITIDGTGHTTTAGSSGIAGEDTHCAAGGIGGRGGTGPGGAGSTGSTGQSSSSNLTTPLGGSGGSGGGQGGGISGTAGANGYILVEYAAI